MQNLVCDQCGKIIGEKEMHGSTHTTASSNPCMQNLACDQCGKIVGEVESHDYGMPFEARFPVDPDDYYYANAVKCDRCGYIKQL
jgi:phage FluMu protein Com